ncbi:hypothetical protein B9Z19DRAFT_1072190 [Tuber borchii]|uniref:Uncharacterized protein n=1 Tax=Tuber borchii TaxID=42251 RepID=A0A2T7A7A9_TUBBO|nr:hypothetical protein B9Z19DRAFT_1072190 [Tuber borchii]
MTTRLQMLVIMALGVKGGQKLVVLTFLVGDFRKRSVPGSHSLLIFGLVGFLSRSLIHYVIGFGEPSGTGEPSSRLGSCLSV